MEKVLFYRCEKCGNMVVSLGEGVGAISCCGQPMNALVANSTEAAGEKHVPVAVIEGEKIEVNVGSVDHPMTVDHYIEWVALATGKKVEIINLKPGMKPKAVFTFDITEDEADEIEELGANCEGQPCTFSYDDNPAEKIDVYAYCNIHGLWKAEI
ncbi:MAG: desulfoferrodoxin [Peptostreptococcaceae bacterium]|nr:desulfoferrodoxin [Peptostreptococcaceae bacterium]